MPEEIISDNGTNFVSSRKRFREANKSNSAKFAATMARKKIKWTFNPPYAPHFGECSKR